MTTPPPKDLYPQDSERAHLADPDHQEALAKQVAVKEQRKLRARRSRAESIWFGLGTFGIIGWSIAVPTLLGILVGLWLDRRYPTGFSWTVALLFAGVTLGIFNAWYWISREREQIEEGRRNDNHR
ncbi:MAG: AtpZ/AtpI family protein [Caldilineaceae bacterium]|nr:AtpZ/AtpI family protein [Caldilineaceae bacterium]